MLDLHGVAESAKNLRHLQLIMLRAALCSLGQCYASLFLYLSLVLLVRVLAEVGL
jgi:hypothetical protein